MADSGRWQSIHPSAFPHEQEALDLLRQRLPDNSPFRAWSNFEFIAEDGSINEVDALIVSTDRVYLIEIKSWSGEISGNQNTWAIKPPNGWERYEENPLLLANRKAKKLKSLLGRQAAFKGPRVPWIQAAVFLSSPQCAVLLDEVSAQHIYQRPGTARAGRHHIVDLIQGRVSEGDGWASLNRETERALSRAMEQLGLRKRTRAATVGDYRLIRLLGENDRYQDWEAQHARVDSDHKRVRIFPYAQKAAAAEKRERKDIATREYQLLREVRHDHILSPGQLTDSEIGPALIYDYRPDAQRLNQVLEAATTPLGLTERLGLVRQLAEALAYAHQRGIYHRALSPWTVEVTKETGGGLSARLRDWQSGSSGQQTQATESRMTMHVGQMAGVIDNAQSAVYLAPEVVAGHGYDPASIDLFSLGALTYAIFSRKHPADDVEQMAEKCRSGPGLLISEVLDGTPDSLQLLIQTATDPKPSDRPVDVREFLALLDKVEDELTTPEPKLGVAPADAKQGDQLTGGFTVVRRMGSGSTCHALSVERGSQIGVLKVAKEMSFNERLRAEAKTLEELHHPNIVKCFGVHEIDGLTAIFMEQAGEQTLGQRLRKEGVLSLDLLERFGDELINALVYLERVGVNHRDIKPENIGIGENRKRALTLKLFDFSLSRAPFETIRAGTPPYLDPFLCNRKPPRWDLHAERFAAGMTLHELATGNLPTWGNDGQDPASTEEEVSLDVEKMDPAVREGLAAFFTKVLNRDYRKRFDNADEMYLAWRGVFQHIDQTTLDESDEGAAVEVDISRIEDLNESTPLAMLGLSPRELNAADRLGATTAGQLLGLHGMRFYRNRGIGQQITRRLRALRDQLAARLGKAPAPDEVEETPIHPSIDRLVKNLESIKLDEGSLRIVSAWLGHGNDDAGLWELPALRDVAEAIGSSRTEVQSAIDKALEKWAKNGWMTSLRDEVAEIVQRREGIVTLEEVAARLLSVHGSTVAGDLRLRHACAVVQAVLETEASREAARFILYRGRSVLLIIATDRLGQAFAAPPAGRAEFAQALAAQAQSLANQDPLPSSRRVEEALAAISTPVGDQPMSAERRLRLAVAAATGVALSSRLEIYPKGLSAERALRLGANTLLGARRLSVEQLHSRIHSRFTHAETLPGRPELDHLLERIEFPLEWHEAGDGKPAGYAMPLPSSGLTRHTSSIRRLTTSPHAAAVNSPEALQAQRFEDTVRRALESRRVLIITCALPHVEQAAQTLSPLLGMDSVSFDRMLIDTLHSQTEQIGADWRVVLQADRAARDSVDWRRLGTLVQRALPTVRRQLLDDPRPLIVQHLGLLVRYGHIGLIQELRDAMLDSTMPARLLLVPGDEYQAPLLDGVALPVITPADWTHLPKSWLEIRHRADSAVETAGNRS